VLDKAEYLAVESFKLFYRIVSYRYNQIKTQFRIVTIPALAK